MKASTVSGFCQVLSTRIASSRTERRLSVTARWARSRPCLGFLLEDADKDTEFTLGRVGVLSQFLANVVDGHRVIVELVPQWEEGPFLLVDMAPEEACKLFAKMNKASSRHGVS